MTPVAVVALFVAVVVIIMVTIPMTLMPATAIPVIIVPAFVSARVAAMAMMPAMLAMAMVPAMLAMAPLEMAPLEMAIIPVAMPMAVIAVMPVAVEIQDVGEKIEERQAQPGTQIAVGPPIFRMDQIAGANPAGMTAITDLAPSDAGGASADIDPAALRNDQNPPVFEAGAVTQAQAHGSASVVGRGA